MSAYSQKLKDPRWQKKRLELFSTRGWACEECGDSEEELHIHHLRYLKGKNPWEYENCDLKCLCRFCHQSIHHDSKSFCYDNQEKLLLSAQWDTENSTDLKKCIRILRIVCLEASQDILKLIPLLPASENSEHIWDVVSIRYERAGLLNREILDSFWRNAKTNHKNTSKKVHVK